MSRVDEVDWNHGRVDVRDVEHAGLRSLLECVDEVTSVRPTNPSVRAAWKGCCPAHDDKNPSLSIMWLHNGRISIKCFAGCTRDAVLRAAGVDPASVAPPIQPRVEASMEDCYEYRDEQGALVFQVCRFPRKRIRFRRPAKNGGWEWKRGDKLLLYRLPEVIAAVKAGERVFVCEGEKDAKRLASLGLCATCNPNGAGRWRREYSEYLRGADVVLLQDNDSAGADHVATVARALGKVAAAIRVALLPELPPKGDVSDWLDAGHTVGELRAYVNVLPPLATTSGSALETLGDDEELKRYGENDQGLWNLRGADQQPRRLANFTARIVRELVEDDGAEQRIVLELLTRRQNKTKSFTVTASEFEEMKWPGVKIDARASITPSTTPREVSYVIRLLSREMASTVLHTHTGWRQLEDGTNVYLHRNGAIGPSGPVSGLRVELDGPLGAVALPDPPTGDALRTTVGSVLDLLRVAPDRIMIPLLAAAFRATLGRAGFSIHLFGPTGVGKTQLAVLIQQFFGAAFEWDSLPGNWNSTANAIEGLLFLAKDMVAVVDDFNPRGSQGDVQRLHQTADRVFRSVANVSARGRMDRDANLRPVKPPRAFLISTGEDTPTGHSLAARILLIEVAEGDVDFSGALTRTQEYGRRGDFAACMSAFLQFHAANWNAFNSSKREMLAILRQRATRKDFHRRTPDATANAMLGWLRFLEFAVWTGAITVDERASFEARAWTALDELAGFQRIYQAQENQARLFVVLIAEALQGKLCHLTTFSGEAPADADRCGWRAESIRDDVVQRPVGPRIGYVDEGCVYLIKNAAYRVAQDMARGGTHSLTLAIRALGQRLLAEKLLRPGETRGGKNYSGRRVTTPEGARAALWAFGRTVFGLADEPEAGQSNALSEPIDDCFDM